MSTMMPFGYKRPPFDQEQEDRPQWHVCWELVPREYEMLLAFLERRKVPTVRERDALAKRLTQAQRREGPPLPTVPNLDWKRAEKAARTRGSSVPEWIEDGAPEPPDQAA